MQISFICYGAGASASYYIISIAPNEICSLIILQHNNFKQIVYSKRNTSFQLIHQHGLKPHIQASPFEKPWRAKNRPPQNGPGELLILLPSLHPAIQQSHRVYIIYRHSVHFVILLLYDVSVNILIYSFTKQFPDYPSVSCIF